MLRICLGTLCIVLVVTWEGGGFPSIQYADDTLVALPAHPAQLCHLKEVFGNFCYLHWVKDEFWEIFPSPYQCGWK
jgi:hypothetical protein